jgi:hypothetical protein
MPDFACRFPQACGKTCMHGTDRNLDDATSALEDTRPRRPLHPHVIAYIVIMPRRMAIATAWVRSRASSLAMMLFM